MELIIGISVATCMILLLALRTIVRRFAVTGGRIPVTTEWIDELSVERYRPMMRLLHREDLDFLRSQPGFTPRMANKLRSQRCQIFRGYLRCLDSDFERVCGAIKVLLLQSRSDRPDLAAILVKSQVTFACGILMVQCRLFLYSWGLGGVDVESLVKMFDSMRLELRTLVPAAMPMSA